MEAEAEGVAVASQGFPVSMATAPADEGVAQAEKEAKVREDIIAITIIIRLNAFMSFFGPITTFC